MALLNPLWWLWIVESCLKSSLFLSANSDPLQCVSSVLFFCTPYTRVMYGIRQCNRIFLSGEIGAFFTEIFFQISVVILNSNLHYQIFKFVIDNSDITSLNCLQHIQKRRNFDAKVTCHQPICLLLHAILSGVGVVFCLPTQRPTFYDFFLSFLLIIRLRTRTASQRFGD